MARTLAVLHSSAISGPLKTLLPRLRLLAADGDVLVLFPAHGAGTKLAAAEFDVRVAGYAASVLPRSPAEALSLPVLGVRELLGLRRALREAQPDVVIVATAYLPLVLLAARLERVPTVLYAAELLGAGRRRGSRSALLGAAAFRRSALLATRIVVPAAGVAGQFPPGRAEIVAPGIAPGSPAQAGLPGTPPRIAVVGALSRGRGQDVAIAALALVREEVPDASLLVVGEPHPRPPDEAFAAELRRRADANVHFLGSVAPVEPLLAAADVVVVPNRVEEGFGRVAFEALAAGTPVVTTPLTAAARLADGHVLVADAERPDLLAASVLRLLREPALGASLARSGRQWVAENLDEAPLARRFVAIVREARDLSSDS